MLPQNFDAPYRSTSLQDFWRRWHMTLSRFLRDYLYIPLGGNRHGLPRQLWALFATMTLGGLWHGAGLTFVAWGVAHGLALGPTSCGAVGPVDADCPRHGLDVQLRRPRLGAVPGTELRHRPFDL